MKNKRIHKIIAYLLLLGTIACTEEIGSPPAGQEPGEARLRITLGKPGVKTRAEVGHPDTSDERQIDAVRLYIFNGTGNDALIEFIEDVTINNQSDGDNGAIVHEMSIRDDGEESPVNRLVAAVANPGSIAPNRTVAHVGMTYADFQRLRLGHSTATPTTPFVMYGEETARFTSGQTCEVSIRMIRLVARIDILNQAMVTQIFDLTEARLTQTPSAGWLVPNVNNPLRPEDVTLLGGLAFQANPSAGEIDEPQKMESLLYSYPVENGAMSLEIKGELNEAQAAFTINLPVDILPNHRYLVVIDNVSTVEIHTRILVSEWDDETIDFNPTAGGAPTVELLTSPASGVLELREKAGTGGTDLLWIPRMSNGGSEETIEFSVTGEYVTSDALLVDAPDWISVESISTQGLTQTFRVTVLPNNVSDGSPGSFMSQREARVQFRNSFQSSLYKEYVIRQAGISLNLWANQNLGTNFEMVNGNAPLTMQQAGDPLNFGGAWWQFGRNVPFTIHEGITPPAGEENQNPITGGGAVSMSNSTVKTSKFINTTTSQWWSEGTTPANDNWTTIAARVGIPGRTGEPCPAGWRMPTSEDTYRIKGTSQITYAAEVGYCLWDEGLETACAYRWERMGPAQTGKYYCVKVEGLKVGTNVTTSNFASLPWDTGVGVIRYFPTSIGNRSRTTGYPDYVGTSNQTNSYLSSINGARSQYWLSDLYSNQAGASLVLIGAVQTGNGNGSNGFAIRCIRE